MMMTNSPIASLELSDDEIRFYKEEGYLVMPGFLDQSVVAALRDEVLDIMDKSQNLSRERLAQAQSTKEKLIQTSQYLKGSRLDAFVNSPHLLSIASQLMEGDGTMYLPFTAVKSGGGGGVFHFHQDNQYTHFDGPGINIWCALSPMSPENGCLQIAPRSHLSGTLDSVENPDGDGHRTVADDPAQFFPIQMLAGDAIAFSRLTLHGSGANTADEPRVAYAIQFHRNDVNATWDGETHLLTAHPRWTNIAPVDEIKSPTQRSQDGH